MAERLTTLTTLAGYFPSEVLFTFTSSRPLSRGSSGTELRNCTSVLRVASVRLCVKRLLGRPAWDIELLEYFDRLLGVLGIHGHFMNSSRPSGGLGGYQMAEKPTAKIEIHAAPQGKWK